MIPKNFDWKKYLKECLDSTEYCCIATVDKKGVWANPVYFAYDEKFNLYFISQLHTRHMQNLKNDPRVSVAIYKTEQKGDVIGTYIEGKGKILEDLEEKIKANNIYYGRKGSLEQNEPFIDDPDWWFVKVTPESVHYFNSKIFNEERQKVPKEVYG